MTAETPKFNERQLATEKNLCSPKEHVKIQRPASMTIYTIVKTSQWLNRARVNHWIRLAFRIKGSVRLQGDPDTSITLDKDCPTIRLDLGKTRRHMCH